MAVIRSFVPNSSETPNDILNNTLKAIFFYPSFDLRERFLSINIGLSTSKSSHSQRLRIPRHLQIAAPNPLAVAVDQITQPFPVNRAGGLAAIEFLVVDDGFDGVEICGGANDPFDRVGGLGERASSY